LLRTDFQCKLQSNNVGKLATSTFVILIQFGISISYQNIFAQRLIKHVYIS